MAISIRRALPSALAYIEAHTRVGQRDAWLRVTLAGLSLLACFLLTFRLDAWPRSWFDEGLNVATAATLARDGIYGLPDSAGVREMDPAIQTGPVVILPVALAFELAGAGLVQARTVMVIFAVFAFVAVFLLARRIAGLAGAAIALALLLAGNGDLSTSFVPLSRQVLGEVPVLGLFGLGAWLLARHIDQPERSPIRHAGLIGVVFGLAMLTKSQMALMLPVSLGLFWVANALYYRVVKWWVPVVITAVACAMVLGWYAAQLAMVGVDGYRQNSEVLREGFSIHIARLSLTGPKSAARVLWSTGFLFWGVPGLVYMLCRSLGRTKESLAALLPLLLTCTWLFWFTFLSIGWGRYAAIPLMIAPIFTGRLVVDFVNGALPLRWARLRILDRRSAREVVAFVAVGAVLVTGFVDGVRDVTTVNSDDRQEIVAYLRREVPSDATVETWAWELDIFVPQPLHHPPTHVTNLHTLEIWDGQAVPANSYDPAVASPDYILANAFSDWTGIYDRFLRERGELVMETGEYRLFRILDE